VSPDRPLPDSRAEYDEAFWRGAAEGRLLVQECADCGARQLHPRPGCRSCGSGELGWLEAEGVGEVYAHTVIRRATEHPWFADEVPYVVAMVELPEGPSLWTTVVDCPPEAVEIGMPVEVTFEAVAEGIALPLFRPR